MSGRLTSEKLKILAMGTMFLDHAAVAMIFGSGLSDWNPLMENIGIAMRLVGRMAFPLYAFLLVQGFMWTRDWTKYLMRVALFALVSEVPFNLVVSENVWYPWAQNTLVTLMIGLICMRMLAALESRFGQAFRFECPNRSCRIENEESNRDLGEMILGIALAVWVVAAAMLAAAVMRSDYSATGVLLIAVLYLFRYRPAESVTAGCLVMVLIYRFSMEVLFAWIAFFLISRYNGERGRKLGLMPYVFYPLHLLAVWLAGTFL